MIDWDTVEDALEDAKGITWDTCHKIYVLMDDEQVAQMREYEYDPIITSDEMSDGEMLNTLKKWFEDSCGLRFIDSVETNSADPNAGFTTLIPQGATDREECEDCLSADCSGTCYLDEEDEEDITEGDDED